MLSGGNLEDECGERKRWGPGWGTVVARGRDSRATGGETPPRLLLLVISRTTFRTIPCSAPGSRGDARVVRWRGPRLDRRRVGWGRLAFSARATIRTIGVRGPRRRGRPRG